MQALQQFKVNAFLLGVSCGARVASELVKAGVTDPEKLEREVVSRVRGFTRPRSH